MPFFKMNEWTKIGLGLTLFGVFFLFLGVIFLFDRGFIAMGNILFVSGIILVIGLANTGRFFMARWKGGICFAVGFFMVTWGYSIIGMIIEIFGFVNLFGDFFPDLLAYLSLLPIIGPLLRPLQDYMKRRRGREELPR